MSDFRGLGAASAAWDAKLSGGQEGRETPETWTCPTCSRENFTDTHATCPTCGEPIPEPAAYDPDYDYPERED